MTIQLIDHGSAGVVHAVCGARGRRRPDASGKTTARSENGRIGEASGSDGSGIEVMSPARRVRPPRISIRRRPRFWPPTQQQAAGTGEQAAAIQQTTTTMEEVTQSGAQISERAKQVAASAEATPRPAIPGCRRREYQPDHGGDPRTGRSRGGELASLSEKTAGDRRRSSPPSTILRSNPTSGAERGDRSGGSRTAA